MNIEKIIAWLRSQVRDNLLIWLAATICFFLFVFAYGCEPTTKSLIDPKRKVSRPELQSELDFIISTSKSRFDDLEKQEQLRQFVFQQVLIGAQSGTVNPVGVITSLLAVLGIFTTADDIRLRKKAKNAGP